jgi:hypothetical protein
MARAGLVAKKVTVQGKHGAHQTTVWVRSDAEHAAHLAHHKAAGTTAAPGSQFTPEAHEVFRRHGITKLPAAQVMPSEIRNVNLNEEGIHFRSVMKWRDTTEQRKQQDSHTQEFHDRNQREHYAVVKTLRPKFAAASAALVKRGAAGDDAAAAGAVIAHTGLRVGGNERVVNKPARIGKNGETIPAHKFHGETVHGVSTLQARHVTVEPDGSVRLNFIGKSAHENNAHITDPAIAQLISSRVAGKSGRDPVFNTDDARVRAAMPTGFRPKDLRTLIAWDTAETALRAHRPPPPMTGNPQTDMRNVLTATRVASQATATALNNSASVARDSYIHPDVWTDWARRVGVPAAWIGLKGVNPEAQTAIIPPRPKRTRAAAAPDAAAPVAPAARMRRD